MPKRPLAERDPLVVPDPDELPFGRAGELDAAGASAPARTARPRLRPRLLALGAVLALIAGALFVTRAGAPSMVDEAILLRCLSPGQAAGLVRPLLTHRTNTVRISPEHAPQVLTVRGTPDQLKSVRSVLDQHEAAGASCAAG